MSEIIFIGTLHAGLTPHVELQKALEQYDPDMLLVEIVQSDIEKNDVKEYPDEMQFALAWARENNVPVHGFDSVINVFATGKSESDNQETIEEQKKALGQLSWKAANAKAVSKVLNTPKARSLINPTKERQREKELTTNIRKVLVEDKRTVVLTGIGHLSFFEKQFPETTFPLRS